MVAIGRIPIWETATSLQTTYPKEDVQMMDINQTEAPKNVTKQQIWEALRATKANLAGKVSYDPQEDARKLKDSKAIASANNAASSDIENQILTLQKSISNYLGGLLVNINDEISRYGSIQDAIRIKREELEEVYGIEAELQSLAVIVNTKSQQEAELQTILNDIERAKTELAQTLTDIRDKAFKDLEAQKDEWQADFDRTARIKHADLEEELAGKRRQHFAYVEGEKRDLDRREKELEAREERLEGAEVAIQDRKDALEKEYYERQFKIETDLKKKYDQDLRVATAESEQKVGRLEDKVKALESDNQKKDMQIADLQAKLDKAYASIQEVAVKASTRVIEVPATK